MGIKFEEALFLLHGNRKLYTIDEISDYRQNNNDYYIKIKNYLFCPECEIPHLVHHKCVNKHDYLSTIQNEFHLADCSFSCDKTTKEMLNTINTTPELIHLNQRLNSCLDLLINGEKRSNPFIIDQENNKDFFEQSKSVSKNRRINYYIPRKRLTKYLNIDCTEDYMIFYGKVKMRWDEKRKNEDYYPNILRIYHIKDGRLICSLKFSDNVYSHLPENLRKPDTKIIFIGSIAFYAKMNSHFDKDSKVVGKTFYSAVINDSRKISVRDIIKI